MSPRPKYSIRTELLINMAVLAAGALILAVGSALLAALFGKGPIGVILLVVLVVADLLIFVGLGHYLVSRLVTRPIEALADATSAVAAGELTRRAPPAATRELDDLAVSMNAMTDRLLDAQQALVRVEKLASVGRLAAGIAHEVGNPLSAIGNYVEVLRRRGVDPQLLDPMEREAQRIDRIVRGLLDFARPQMAERERLDPGALARDVVELLEQQGLLRPLQVGVRVDDQTPAVCGNRGALEQVLVNLLVNAIDAAGPGGRIEVVVSPTVLGRAEGARRSADDAAPADARGQRRPSRHLPGRADGTPAAAIVVADSGPGVSEDMVQRIFDPFFTTKDPGKGTGLGLAIVQRIIEDHGGRIDVGRSREGGAVFTVTLPPDAA